MQVDAQSCRGCEGAAPSYCVMPFFRMRKLTPFARASLTLRLRSNAVP